MKLYLAGPMRGLPECNFPAFHKAARELRAAGHTVWSPAENDIAFGLTGESAQKVTTKAAMSVDLPALLQQDAIALLPGWEKSRGVAIELYVAKACDMPVYTIESLLVEYCL
jgi:hypothetical protein